MSTTTTTTQCTLIADRTDDSVQLVLGLVALSSLFAKWRFESPRRPLRIWFLDAMKQGTSAAIVHVLNILFAILIAGVSAQEDDDADQCAFYFMNVVVDTTLGVYIAFVLLQFVTALAVRRDWASLKHPGRYGDPPSCRTWWIQLTSWVIILVVMKLIVGVLLYVFRAAITFAGAIVFYPVRNHPKIELLIVMIGCPLVMNMVQFWIQDSFLKDHSKGKNEALPLLNKTQLPASAKPIVSVDSKKSTKNMTTATNAADMYEDL
ncbi:TPA: hypothetical protein N0F65_006335 [Lagenidium giganteum]|uniref:Vacuolar membrane protein n=1 Tax=Lagenidium giganteum TaxID=4803 RepID=A0AAV2YR07_9STRA|nr:TPA: hypothetical protein N0F65_006335 [Lagenidium giganteum]